MKHAVLLSLGLAFAATASVSTAHDAIGAAVDRHAPKSWFTPTQKAFIQAKCGVDVDRHNHNLDINGSTMTCPDGRTFDDPQVRVISEDISRRVNEYTRNIMNQADVQRATAMTTREAVRKMISNAQIDARLAEAMAHAQQARAIDVQIRQAINEAHIERQVEQALAQAEIGRKTAERVRDALAKAGMDDTH